MARALNHRHTPDRPLSFAPGCPNSHFSTKTTLTEDQERQEAPAAKFLNCRRTERDEVAASGNLRAILGAGMKGSGRMVRNAE